MKDKLISLDALRKEVERNFDMQNLYLPVHILDVAEDAEEGIVRCKDCAKQCTDNCLLYWNDINTPDNWYCADGVKR